MKLDYNKRTHFICVLDSPEFGKCPINLSQVNYIEHEDERDKEGIIFHFSAGQVKKWAFTHPDDATEIYNQILGYLFNSEKGGLL